jgi:hypothetical protein
METQRREFSFLGVSAVHGTLLFSYSPVRALLFAFSSGSRNSICRFHSPYAVMRQGHAAEPILHRMASAPATSTKGKTMTAIFPPKTCPFCGLPANVPHETQAGCIEALQAEIERTRQVINGARDPAAAPPRPDEDVQVT